MSSIAAVGTGQPKERLLCDVLGVTDVASIW